MTTIERFIAEHHWPPLPALRPKRDTTGGDYHRLATCLLLAGKRAAKGNKPWEARYREEAEAIRRRLRRKPERRERDEGLRRQIREWLRLFESGLDADRGLAAPHSPGAPELGASAVAPTHDGFCGRCESYGHALESCPFDISDADTARIAAQRRERRARAA